MERRRWISERRFLHALNYCMVLPGPEAQQLATYIGWLMHRSWGGIVAGVLVRAAVAVHSDRTVLALHGLGRDAAGGGSVLRHQAGGHGHRAAGGLAHRVARTQEWRAVGYCRGGFRGHLRLEPAVSPDRRRCRIDGLHRRPPGAGQVQDRWRPRRARTSPTAGPDRRRHAHARACALSRRAPAARGHGGCAAVDACPWPCSRLPGLESCLHADGLVLHQGRAADLWRRLRRAALRLPGRGRLTTAGWRRSR